MKMRCDVLLDVSLNFFRKLAFVIVLLVFPMVILCAPNEILGKLDKIAEQGESASWSSYVEVTCEIQKYPSESSKILQEKLKDQQISVSQTALYVWALGETRDESAVDQLISLHKSTFTERVKGNCIKALATIGGEKSGKYIVSLVEAEKDPEERFPLLVYLGQSRYEPGLPLMEEVLRKSPDQFYWQSIFVFGKMGDACVPFLISKLNDEDHNIRMNTIILLGKWLIPPEAAKPMQERYWKEPDKQLKSFLLSSLEVTMPDLDEIKAFFKKVSEKEKDEELKKFATETVQMNAETKKDAKEYAKNKKVSKDAFEKEYCLIYGSMGHQGSCESLKISSGYEDEGKLKRLREEILSRGSDECFSDYQEVNQVIMWNRIAKWIVGNKKDGKKNSY